MHVESPPTPLARFPRPEWGRPEPSDPSVVQTLQSGLGLPASICRLLECRGLGDLAAAKRFLKPHSSHLHPPDSLASIGKAAERIAAAVTGGEVILVHGDYDVDGICGAAMLTRALTMMGGRVVPFVPHRIEHGYDLRDAGVAAAQHARASLIVTVDCGIVALEAVRNANAAGIDVVVSDHHTPGDLLPDAVAVVNPNRVDCAYPEKGLCGSAVGYKLALAVAAQLGFDPARLAPLLDLVAIATVADLVPLNSENRALVRWGLSILHRSPNPGLRALIRVCGLSDRPEITAGHVGFVLAPRINAAGRIGDPDTPLRLLLTDDQTEADRLARSLEEQNQRRRDLDEWTLERAMEQIEAGYDPENDWGVVLAADDWHPGVIGIVASRVVERIHRPVFLLAVSDREVKGSGRSIPGFHVHSALLDCAPHLQRFGGHRMAGGCSLDAASIDEFRLAFNEAAHRQLQAADLLPRLRIDAEVALADVTPEFVNLLRHFAPFGVGNPTPVLMASGVEFKAAKQVGRGHLKVQLGQAGGTLEAIGFNLFDRIEEVNASQRHDVVFKAEINEWQTRSGQLRSTVQARIVDFRPA